MSIGNSGRVVIEIEADLKRRLHSNLAAQGLTLKGWFVSNAEAFVRDGAQMQLIGLTGKPSMHASMDNRSSEQTNKKFNEL